MLRISGADELGGADVTIGPDHIEAASVAAIGALSGGRIQIEGIRAADMRVIAKIYWRLGIQLDVDEAAIFVPKQETLSVSSREEDVELVD